MKLARPDVFHPRIVLAGCPALPDGDGDDAGLVAALRKRGLHARWLSWDDPETLDADVVILRAAWDYIDRLDEFLAWTRRVRNLLNAPKVVAWNTDKRYLADLAKAGVPTVPSRFFAPGERVRLPDGEVVVKPAVGAGSVGAQRFIDPEAARAHAASCRPRAAPCWCSPMIRGWRTAKPRWCSCRWPPIARVHQGADPAAAGRGAGLRRVRHLRGGIADACRARLRAVGRRPRGAGRGGRASRHGRRRAVVRPRRHDRWTVGPAAA